MKVCFMKIYKRDNVVQLSMLEYIRKIIEMNKLYTSVVAYNYRDALSPSYLLVTKTSKITRFIFFIFDEELLNDL